MYKLLSIFFVLLIIATFQMAYAAGGADHGDGVPGVVLYQFINFGLFIGLLVYLLRKPVAAYMQGRVTSFREQFERAKKLKDEAEAAKSGLKAKLDEIAKTEDAQIKKAEEDANAMRVNLLSEADSMAAQIVSDADKNIELEYFKANKELRVEALEQVLGSARKNLESSISDSDQTVLRKEFIEQVQVVQ